MAIVPLFNGFYSIRRNVPSFLFSSEDPILTEDDVLRLKCHLAVSLLGGGYMRVHMQEVGGIQMKFFLPFVKGFWRDGLQSESTPFKKKKRKNDDH